MRRLLAGSLLALLIAAAPLAVMAQGTALDEESRAAVVEMAQSVGRSLALSGTVTSGNGAASNGTEELEPNVIEEPQEPMPQPEEAEPEPTSEQASLPELNLTDLVEYSNQGVTFLAPADWIVDTEFGEDTPFFIEVPGTEIFISMEADAGLDFPSWLGVALFRSQADLFITELGEDAQIDESVTLFTDQNLPVAKLAFSGTDNGEAVGGALYAVAPNENAYLMIGGGPGDEWAYAMPGIDVIAESLVFDEELVTVTFVEDEPLLYSDADGTVELTVPQGWYVMSTGDPQFPVIAAEPEVRFVAAIGGRTFFGDTFDDSILDIIPESGELDAEQQDELFSEITTLLEDSGSPIVIDEELSSLQTREGAATIRLAGDADLGDGLMMPVVFYIDLRTDSVGVVAVFGDTESALGVEAEIQSMLESVTE